MRIRARLRQPVDVVQDLARALLLPRRHGDPAVTIDDLTTGLRACAAASERPGPHAARLPGWRDRLVRAARTGDIDRAPMTWTQLAAALDEPLPDVLARYPHLVADPRTGPTTPAETAAAAAARPPVDPLPTTIGRLRVP